MGRKVLISMAAVGFLGLGCSDRQQYRDARQDLAEEKREAREDIAEARQNVAAEARDLREERRDNDSITGEVPSAEMNTVAGTLTTTFGPQITVEAPGGEDHTFVTDANTKVMQNGKVVDADDVRNGAKVKVQYFERAGIKVARDVQVTDATPARSYGRTPTRDNR